MIKYIGYTIAFQEVPNETTLCINVSNCMHRCAGCHSPELWEDNGADLERDIIDLIKRYRGITCVCLFGEGNDWDAFNKCLILVRCHYPDLKLAWYTGLNDYAEEVHWYIDSGLLDYIKTGPYIASRGGLDNPLTNQRMYKIEDGIPTDITYKFQKKGFHNNAF